MAKRKTKKRTELPTKLVAGLEKAFTGKIVAIPSIDIIIRKNGLTNIDNQNISGRHSAMRCYPLPGGGWHCEKR